MLQIYDLAPVEFPVLLRLVEVGARARIEVGVVVSADDDDVAVAVTGAGPGLLHGFEPVYAALDFGEGAEVGEVAGMDEDIAWWEALGWDLGVSVGNAYTTN